MLLSWSAGPAEMSDSLRPCSAPSMPRKAGATPARGRYSNGKFDAMLEDALVTINDASARRCWRCALRKLRWADQGIIRYFQMNVGR